MSHDPLCGWHTDTNCFESDDPDDCFECIVIARTRADERSNNFTPDDVSEIVTKVVEEVLDDNDHDHLCPNASGTCCPWMGNCDCQCMCDFIQEVRKDERRNPAPGIKTGSDYMDGYIAGLYATSWTCLDCGNIYDTTVDRCPNDILDGALARARAKRA